MFLVSGPSRTSPASFSGLGRLKTDVFLITLHNVIHRESFRRGLLTKLLTPWDREWWKTYGKPHSVISHGNRASHTFENLGAIRKTSLFREFQSPTAGIWRKLLQRHHFRQHQQHRWSHRRLQVFKATVNRIQVQPLTVRWAKRRLRKSSSSNSKSKVRNSSLHVRSDFFP